MTETALKNRVILITGATGALGSVAAKACARAGASVVLLGRSVPKLERLYDEIVSTGGQQPALYPLDLAGASEQDYADLASTVQRELGGLHGLMHCAAELGHLCPLTELAGERWQRLLHVNLTAPFLLTRALMPLLLATKGAAAVFVGDSAVGDGKAFWGAYGVAKLGLGAYARILKAETENSELRTELFIPGPMRSPIRLRAYPGESLDTLPAPGIHAERIIQLLVTAEPPPIPDNGARS
jgi:NAD(P)-dependent dehydrogenase (short-subunit alcohol dehydrogenase family)